MSDFLHGVMDHWRVAALYRQEIRYCDARAYSFGYYTGAVLYHLALVAVGVGLGTVMYYGMD